MVSKKKRVIVCGGGFGGLETASYLKHFLKDKIDVTLVSDKDYFLFKPNTIYIPFGKDPSKFVFSYQKGVRKTGISFHRAVVEGVDPVKQRVYFDGKHLEYDYLVIALGAKMKPEEIPGLAEHAYTIWTPDEMLRLREGIERLIRNAEEGKSQEVLFVVPPNNKCSGPLYELVFMLDTFLRRRRVRDKVSITYTTYEKAFIQAFGPKIHQIVAEEFLKRSIKGYNEYVVSRVEDKRVIFRDGKELPYDLLISFPPYYASTALPGLKTDERGFILTKLETRQVVDYPNVYVVGDISDFPVKQAFLALLQADTVAAHIISEVEKTDFTSAFVPTSMCIMEQLDKATFAQVPLRVTGRADMPVEVRQSDINLYKAGTSKLWRIGKKILGMYLPWRFKNLKPFHAGTPWKIMDFGLRVIMRLLAS